MSEGGRPITEEDLHAYVDGLLDAETRLAVERYLRRHADVARRVSDYGVQRDELRAAFADRAAEPLPASLNLSRLIETRLSRPRTHWRAAAAVTLALGLGATAGWFAGARPVTGISALALEAGANYAVYAADKRRPVEMWAAQRDDLTRWLSKRLNRPVAPPDLSGVGYRLLGGRLAAAPRGPAALFIYENDHGVRLAVYVRPMTASGTTPIEQVDIGNLDGCAWIEGGVGYTVIAAEPYSRLLELSTHVRQQVEALS